MLDEFIERYARLLLRQPKYYIKIIIAFIFLVLYSSALLIGTVTF